MTDPRLPRILNKRTDRIPPGAYYCGRPGPLGNPFVIGRDGTRDDVVDKFDAWAPTQPKLMAIIATLEGRDLVCWCAPLRCHCEPIRRLANPKLFAEAVGRTSTAEQAGADGTKLYKHTVTIKQDEDGWWICEDGTPLEGPFSSQDSAIAAVEAV